MTLIDTIAENPDGFGQLTGYMGVAIVVIGLVWRFGLAWIRSLDAADSFAEAHISENCDVAAIEAGLPDMRDHAQTRRRAS